MDIIGLEGIVHKLNAKISRKLQTRNDQTTPKDLRKIAETVFHSDFEKTFDFDENPKRCVLLLKFLRAC